MQLNKLLPKLQKHPDTKYQSGADFIRVFPNSRDGFNVELVVRVPFARADVYR